MDAGNTSGLVDCCQRRPRGGATCNRHWEVSLSYLMCRRHWSQTQNLRLMTISEFPSSFGSWAKILSRCFVFLRPGFGRLCRAVLFDIQQRANHSRCAKYHLQPGTGLEQAIHRKSYHLGPDHHALNAQEFYKDRLYSESTLSINTMGSFLKWIVQERVTLCHNNSTNSRMWYCTARLVPC